MRRCSLLATVLCIGAALACASAWSQETKEPSQGQAVQVTPGPQRERLDEAAGSEIKAGDETAATDGDGDGQSGPVISMTPEGVSIYAVRQDVHAVLTELARQTGFPIIVDDTVKGKVTINFRNRKVTEILRDIAATNGFACREQDGVFVVTEGLPGHVSSYLLADIVRVTPNYIPASDAEQLLPVFLQDFTAPSVSQNSIVLSAPPEILEKFRSDVEQFDIPAAQIMIEVLMVEFSKNTTDEFFAKLGWTGGGNQVATDSSQGDMSFRVFGELPDEFRFELRALEGKGQAHVRANPRVATVSGQKALIFIGERRFLARPVEVVGGEEEDGEDFMRRQINFINAGVNLTITPWTGGEGEIVSEISTEVSTMSAPDAITGLPEKQTRTATTTVRMLDGETLIIGGLVQDELIQTKTKVPILGDIPLIGKLFRSEKTRRHQTELVVFITSRILSQNGEAKEAPADTTP